MVQNYWTMKSKTLLSLFLAATALGASAQKSRTVAYAITGAEKGSQQWTEVKLIDLATGEEIQPVYNSKQELPLLNARTGKAITRKEPAVGSETFLSLSPSTPGVTSDGKTTTYTRQQQGDVVIIRRSISDAKANNGSLKKTYTTDQPDGQQIRIFESSLNADQPFATKSAACAYDKKHDRLYYTPMGINELRYIDLKTKSASVNYFQDEPFGALKGRHDINNQVTRMVIASDGNGYALTNNGDHLVKFTTRKKAEITDLGSLTDDAANGKYSVHSNRAHGGDMIADDKGALYLITANRQVFKIDTKTMTATFKGLIQGLPAGFTTNGAAVSDEMEVIVSSANTTMGYYKFDITKLQAEKISAASSVYTASDLANANLLSARKISKEEVQVTKPVETLVKPTETMAARTSAQDEALSAYRISVYPNPVTSNGTVSMLFSNYPEGRYTAQFMDISGRTISSSSFDITGRNQVKQLSLPKGISKGNYLVRILGDGEKPLTVEQVVVQ